MKPNASKKRLVKPVAGSKNTSGSLVKTKMKKASGKPGLIKMIFFWILAILLLAAIFLRVRHYFNAHW